MSKLQLGLFVAGIDDEVQQQLDQLGLAMDREMGAGNWIIDVIDVLEEPEKALRSDIFATPTLVRVTPPPVLKLIGDIIYPDKILSMVNLAKRSN